MCATVHASTSAPSTVSTTACARSYIQPDECVECGACEPVCPVNAIFQQNDLPDEWRHYAQIERQFFEPGVTDLGAPGGAVEVGTVGYDHPDVAALPPFEDQQDV
jgi:ferredoxin